MLQIEHLEDRITPTAFQIGGNLYLRGDNPAGSQIVATQLDADTVVSNIDGVVQVWDGVTSLRMFGTVGPDVLENRTALPSTLQGSYGDDILIGGTGVNSLQPFHGNDTVIATCVAAGSIVVASADAALGFVDVLFANGGTVVLKDAVDVLTRVECGEPLPITPHPGLTQEMIDELFGDPPPHP